MVRWTLSWRPITYFVLNDQENIELNMYIGPLQLSMINLRMEEDVLIWNGASCGKYTPKEGYIFMSAQNNDVHIEWWWQKIWKFHCPPKTCLFWWCVLENKVPCWENILKRGFIGPGWCALCRNAKETTAHLFLSCSYCVVVWGESCTLLGLDPMCRWEGDSIMHA